jgi:hypothetical protein
LFGDCCPGEIQGFFEYNQPENLLITSKLCKTTFEPVKEDLLRRLKLYISNKFLFVQGMYNKSFHQPYNGMSSILPIHKEHCAIYS